jgi:tetratricopeptide (TPR) repeat protein
MVGPVREEVHIRILAALEDEDASGREADALCYHATRAKAWAKAFAYGRDVARKCVGRSAFADATAYYEIAIDAVDKTPHSREREIEAIDLRTEARLAFMGLGRIAEWFDLGKEAERRANAIDDLGRKVAAMSVRAAAQNFYGTPIEAIDTGEQVVELAGKWGDRGWLNAAEFGLGQAYFIAGHYLKADEMLARASAQLMSPQAIAPMGTTVDYMLLMCCMVNSVVNTNLGNRDNADRLRRLAREIADRSERPFDRVVAAVSDATFMLGDHDPAAAANVLDEAYALAERHGVRMFIPALACYRGIAYLEQDRVAEARAVLAQAQETSKAIGYKSMELRTSLHLARLSGRTGAIGEALEMLRHTTNTAQQQGFSGIEAEARLLQAAIIPVVNDEGRSVAIHHLRMCIELSSRNGAQPLVLTAEELLGKVAASGRDVRFA